MKLKYKFDTYFLCLVSVNDVVINNVRMIPWLMCEGRDGFVNWMEILLGSDE